jgi:hypothetical protein
MLQEAAVPPVNGSQRILAGPFAAVRDFFKQLDKVITREEHEAFRF